MIQNKTEKNQQFHLSWLRILIILLLVIGIFFRFVNLEKKPYWGDEADSLSWISGTSNFQEIALQGHEMSAANVLKFQRPDPEANLIDTYKAIYYEHAPLYYLIARLWMQLNNSDLITSRSLTALISLLAFPCIYWLCLELFNSSLVGWMAISLLAISPFHLLYAQEARQYSLWIVLILLSSWSLLRTIRVNTKLSWTIYTATLTLMLYTHLISVMVVFAYSIYVIAQEGFRLSKKVITYFFSSLTAFILFIPWIIVIFSNLQGGLDHSPAWSKEPTRLAVLIRAWVLNLSRVFWDFNESFINENLLLYLLTLSLAIYSVYFLCRHTQKRIWLFLVLLIIAPILFFAIPDILLGGRRSTPIRYFIPSYLALEITVAYLLASLSTFFLHTSAKKWQQKFWQITTVVLISSGVLSCTVISQADTWWNKHREYYHSEVAKIVNQTAHPLIIAPWFDMRTLSHSLASNVTLQDIRLRKDISSVGNGFSDVFIYQDQNVLKYFLENHLDYKIENTYNWRRQTTPVDTTSTVLWQLAKKRGIKNKIIK